MVSRIPPIRGPKRAPICAKTRLILRSVRARIRSELKKLGTERPPLTLGKGRAPFAPNAEGLHTTQVLGTLFDGITRHTAEGYAFQQRAAEADFREAVGERDKPFGDRGPSTFKG